MKTIFMGTPELAVAALQRVAALTDCVQVITQPDRPAGRGKKMRAPPVKVAAEALGIPVWQPETLRGITDVTQVPELQGADMFIVMAYGEILRQNILDIPRYGCVNIHGSLLPRWRGASPLQATIRAGDAETGVAIMEMVRALDAGPVYLQQSFTLSAASTLESVHDAMGQCAADAIDTFIQRYPNVTAQAQDETAVTYCGKLVSADGHLDFAQSVAELDAWIRAYTPAPGCWVMADGQRMRILEARPAPAYTEDIESGAVRTVDKRSYVGCADGALEILRIQAAGKRPMAVGDFTNGKELPQMFS